MSIGPKFDYIKLLKVFKPDVVGEGKSSTATYSSLKVIVSRVQFLLLDKLIRPNCSASTQIQSDFAQNNMIENSHGT